MNGPKSQGFVTICPIRMYIQIDITRGWQNNCIHHSLTKKRIFQEKCSAPGWKTVLWSSVYLWWQKVSCPLLVFTSLFTLTGPPTYIGSHIGCDVTFHEQTKSDVTFHEKTKNSKTIVCARIFPFLHFYCFVSIEWNIKKVFWLCQCL